jgi:ribonuclease P protein component
VDRTLKILRIKKRRDFVAIQDGHKFKVHGRNILLLVRRTDDFYLNRNRRVNICRDGIVATKKISKRAVVRNRIKRIIRELIRINREDFKVGFDYEFIAKKGFLESDFRTLKGEVRWLLNKVKEREDFGQ